MTSDGYSKTIMICTKDDYDPVEVRFEVSHDDLHFTDLLGIIDRFLKATGWHYDGELQIVKDEKPKRGRKK